MSLFDRCAECKRCCHVDDGAPPLEVNLTSAERRAMKPICVESRCTHLASTGCSLGKSKPFGCDLYPLAYDPGKRLFHFDRECPLLDSYIGQLKDAGSDAARHLARMKTAIASLEKTDAEYLRANFAFDRDYFDLVPVSRMSE